MRIPLAISLVTAVSCIQIACNINLATYVPSGPSQRTPVPEEQVLVYYNEVDVPFQYREIGRITLKSNYWALQDSGSQVAKIKTVAAKNGATAVIIMQYVGNESSFGAYGNSGGGFVAGTSGAEYRVTGIAIIKME